MRALLKVQKPPGALPLAFRRSLYPGTIFSGGLTGDLRHQLLGPEPAVDEEQQAVLDIAPQASKGSARVAFSLAAGLTALAAQVVAEPEMLSEALATFHLDFLKAR